MSCNVFGGDPNAAQLAILAGKNPDQPIPFSIGLADTPFRGSTDVFHPLDRRLSIWIPRNSLLDHAVTFGQFKTLSQFPFAKTIEHALDIWCGTVIDLAAYDFRRRDVYNQFPNMNHVVVTITNIKSAVPEEGKNLHNQIPPRLLGWIAIAHIKPLRFDDLKLPSQLIALDAAAAAGDGGGRGRGRGRGSVAAAALADKMLKDHAIKRTERYLKGDPATMIAEKITKAIEDAESAYKRAVPIRTHRKTFYASMNYATYQETCGQYMNDMESAEKASGIADPRSAINPWNVFTLKRAREFARNAGAPTEYTDNAWWQKEEPIGAPLLAAFPNLGKDTFRLKPTELCDIHRREFPRAMTIDGANPHLAMLWETFYGKDQLEWKQRVIANGGRLGVVPRRRRAAAGGEHGAEEEKKGEEDEEDEEDDGNAGLSADIDASKWSIDHTDLKRRAPLYDAVARLHEIKPCAPTLVDFAKRVNLTAAWRGITMPPTEEERKQSAILKDPIRTVKEKLRATMLRDRLQRVRQASVFDLKSKGKALWQKQNLADFLAVLTPEGQISDPQKAHARWASEQKTFCHPRKTRYHNLSEFGNMIADKYLYFEEIYHVHSSHAVSLMMEIAAWGATSHIRLKVHLLVLGLTAKGKTRGLRQLENKLIPGTYVPFGSESDKSMFDGNAEKRLDWQIRGASEANDKIFGISKAGSAGANISHGKAAGAADSSAGDYTAHIRDILSDGGTSYDRLVPNPDPGSIQRFLHHHVSFECNFCMIVGGNFNKVDMADNMASRWATITQTLEDDRDDTSLPTKMNQKRQPVLDEKEIEYRERFQRDQYLCAVVFQCIKHGLVDDFDVSQHTAIMVRVFERAAEKGLKNTDYASRNDDRVKHAACTLQLVHAIHRLLDSETAVFRVDEKIDVDWYWRFIRAIEPLLVIQPEVTVFSIHLFREQWEGTYQSLILERLRLNVNLDRLIEKERGGGGAVPHSEGKDPASSSSSSSAAREPMQRTFNLRPCTKCKSTHIGPCPKLCPGGCKQLADRCFYDSCREKADAAKRKEAKGYSAGMDMNGADIARGLLSVDIDDSSAKYVSLYWDDHKLVSSSRGHPTNRDRIRVLAARMCSGTSAINISQALQYYEMLLENNSEFEDANGVSVRGSMWIEFVEDPYNRRCVNVRIARHLFHEDAQQSLVLEAIKWVLGHEGFRDGSYIISDHYPGRPYLLQCIERPSVPHGQKRLPFRIVNPLYTPKEMIKILGNDSDSESESDEEEEEGEGKEEKKRGRPEKKKTKKKKEENDVSLEASISSIRSSARWLIVNDPNEWEDTTMLDRCFSGYYGLKSLAEYKCVRHPRQNLLSLLKEHMNNEFISSNLRKYRTYPDAIFALYPKARTTQSMEAYERSLPVEERRRMEPAYLRRQVSVLVGHIPVETWAEYEATWMREVAAEEEAKAAGLSSGKKKAASKEKEHKYEKEGKASEKKKKQAETAAKEAKEKRDHESSDDELAASQAFAEAYRASQLEIVKQAAAATAAAAEAAEEAMHSVSSLTSSAKPTPALAVSQYTQKRKQPAPAAAVEATEADGCSPYLFDSDPRAGKRYRGPGFDEPEPQSEEEDEDAALDAEDEIEYERERLAEEERVRAEEEAAAAEYEAHKARAAAAKKGGASAKSKKKQAAVARRAAVRSEDINVDDF